MGSGRGVNGRHPFTSARGPTQSRAITGRGNGLGLGTHRLGILPRLIIKKRENINKNPLTGGEGKNLGPVCPCVKETYSCHPTTSCRVGGRKNKRKGRQGCADWRISNKVQTHTTSKTACTISLLHFGRCCGIDLLTCSV